MTFLEEYDQHYAPRLGIRADGFKKMFELLSVMHKPMIVETGCARMKDNWEGDGQSSYLFSRFAALNDGSSFISIEIDRGNINTAMEIVAGNKAKFVHGDSVDILRGMASDGCVMEGFPDPSRPIDLLYLDSYDFDVSNPMPAATHHLFELCSAMPLLARGSIICVDDNFSDDGKLIGKGMLVAGYMSKIGITPVHVGYQIIWVL